MPQQDRNYSNRERKTIILLSVVMLLVLGVLLVVDNHSPDSSRNINRSGKERPGYYGHTADTAYRRQMTERRRRLQEHYKRQAEHYRLQEEYYEQKDKYYRQEIERMRGLSTQRGHMERPLGIQATASPGRRDATVVYSPKFTSPTTIDPNTADSATLCSIPGIGRGIASSILHMRERLGGFYDLSQLLECAYFSVDLLQWFALDRQPELQQIDINKAGFGQLIRHPYISKAQTQDILQYRRLYGTIKDSVQLHSTGIFTADELHRLLPYLKF